MSENPILDALANEFFRVFSRAEYSLKASGFHKGDGEANANWGKFSREVEDLIRNPISQDLREAISFMLSSPPKKQVIKQGILCWEECIPSTNSTANLLFLYIRRVRNNLFHGGKFNGRWFEPERSEPLLKFSLIILRAAIDKVPRVCDAYYHE